MYFHCILQRKDALHFRGRKYILQQKCKISFPLIADADAGADADAAAAAAAAYPAAAAVDAAADADTAAAADTVTDAAAADEPTRPISN